MAKMAHPHLVRAALDAHRSPMEATAALLAAAVELATEVVGPDQVWDVIGAILDVSQAAKK